MTDEQNKPTISVKPIGRVKKSPSFLEHPIVQDIVNGLLIPLAKGAILSIVERALYGDQGNPGPTTSLSSGRVLYQNHSQQTLKFPPANTQQSRFQQYQKVRSQFPQLDNLIFRNEEECTLVINALYDRIDLASYATVADLYDVIGQKIPDFTYNQFGWNLIQLARYELRQLPNGVELVMPRPFPLVG